MELDFLTITHAARLFRARQLSPLELTRHLIERSSRLDDTVHGYVTFTPDIALRQARAAEMALSRGEDSSPLLGIPMGYKDIYCTKGVLTTGGSQLLKDFVPEVDATAVARLQHTGAVMMGKLTTWEFAAGSADVLQSYFPSARNPWNLDHSPQGSSSGSGATLAAGMVMGALGTDTGGSIRWPAAACGVVGLKPTHGRVSRFGVYPLSWSLDHTGPMARTVEDVALMLNALAGHDPLDSHSARAPVSDYTQQLTVPIRGLRLGVPGDDYLAGCDGEELSAFFQAVDTLTELGAVKVPVEMPSHQVQAAGGFISMVEAYAYHRDDLLETPWNFGARLGHRFKAGGLFFAHEFVQAQRVSALLKEHMRRLLLDVDVVLTPTQAGPAPTMEELSRQGLRRSGTAFMRLFNQTGLPSLSLPSGFSNAGLPHALQISGRPFDEATVLRVGHAYQQVTDWHTRHPKL